MPPKQLNVTQETKSVQQMLGLVPGVRSSLSDAVFVCIDCEAYEHAQHKITELGVAVLDTRDTFGIGAGKDGQAWIDKIQYAHFRPVEYAKLVNRRFIKGCEQGFNFGSTTWINLSDARQILTNIFSYPSQLQRAGESFTRLSASPRNVIFVAHGASSDTAYLKQMRFDLSADADVAMILDTQRMAGGSKKHGIKLQRLLLSLDMQPVNLHNAGNDAAYTLQSMVRMALKDHSSPGSVAADLQSFMGKLPPLKYNLAMAPHVWAGSATESDDAESAAPRDTRSATSVQTKVERRERKHAFRAAGAGARPTTEQKPLPSFNGRTDSG